MATRKGDKKGSATKGKERSQAPTRSAAKGRGPPEGSFQRSPAFRL